MFIQETKLNSRSFQRLKTRVGIQNVLDVESEGKGRDIAILWKDEVDLVIKIFSKNHIHTKATRRTNGQWRLTGVYGHPDASIREYVCNLLKSLRQGSNEDLPWVRALTSKSSKLKYE